MNKNQKFFKGKLYKSIRGNFFEEDTYESTERKNLKGKSNFSSLINQQEPQELADEGEEIYENEWKMVKILEYERYFYYLMKILEKITCFSVKKLLTRGQKNVKIYSKVKESQSKSKRRGDGDGKA